MLSLCLCPLVITLKSGSLAASAVDWSKPVQTSSNFYSWNLLSSQFTTVQDWKEWTFNIGISSLFPNGRNPEMSFDVYAADNYGEDFEVWISVIDTDDSSKYYLNSGWKKNINKETFNINETNSHWRIVLRVRYNPDSGHTNPPTNYVWNGLRLFLNWSRTYNYSPIPDDWTVTTTAVTSTFPTYPTITTTINPDNIPQIISNYNPWDIESVLTSWIGFGSVLGSFGIALPWLTVLIGFVCLCAILRWLLY